MGAYREVSRTQLEHALEALESNTGLKEPVAEVQRLLHELQVHQIELEAQNKDLKEAQQQLEESRSRYADLFDFAPVGYCTFDRHGLVLEINITATAMFRIARANAVGKGFTQIVALSDPSAFRAHLNTCFTEEVRVTTEITITPKEQAPIVIQMVSSPVINTNGVVVACRTTLTNISALKSSENILRFLADASEALSSSLEYSHTLATVVRLAVPVLADICFLDILDEDNQLRRLEVAFADEGKRFLVDAIKRAVPELDSKAPEIQVLRSGKARAVSDGPRSLHDSLPPQIAGIARSVLFVPLTARERTLGVLTLIMAESARSYSPRELAVAQDVGRRAAMALDNARLYDTARQAIRGREDILAIVSHDLKEPLNGITLASSTLESWSKVSADAQTNRLLQIVLRSAHRMDRLINELLDCSSIQSGHLSVRKRDCSVQELLSDAQEMFTQLADEDGITLHVEPLPAPMMISCDRERIYQVLSNLIGNGIKFTESGGRVELRVEDRGDEVLFKVSDTGPGIPKDRLPRLFEQFWQAEDSSKKGRGLGLFIAKGIVVAHDGKIWAESRLGDGTTLFVSLPKGTLESSQERRSTRPRAQLDDAIMVVDDDPEIRDLLAGILEQEGSIVTQMPNGRAALEYLRDSGLRPRLILLDLRMPIMDGWQCMSELRNDAEFAAIPVVVVSSAEFAPQAASLGIDFLEKPVRIDRLLETVRRYRVRSSSVS
ncbi:ATP-binding protein [Pendulispora brunnea]|uniref:histidine kinase n=1 Tax=Pendulispora brunnea TaxID=2905690 RepID=A0ABZ2KEZ7_9BACT